MKNTVLLLAAILTALCAGALYRISSLSPAALQMCALNVGGLNIPAQACRSYLIHWQNIDQAWLNHFYQEGGLSFVLTDDESGDYAEHLNIAEILINKGVNINKIDPMSGYTPLHSAVLLNNLAAVDFLLQHQADMQQLDSQFHKTPLQLLQWLQHNKPEIDRSAVQQALIHAQY